MVQNMRKAHGAAFKARVALEAVKGEKTIAQLSSEVGVHANQIRQWREQLLEEFPWIFSSVSVATMPFPSLLSLCMP
jgi:transposase-like protein